MSRLITGLLATGIWGVILYSGSYHLVWFFVLVVSIIGLYEYLAICLPQSSLPIKYVVLTISTLPLLATYQESNTYLLPSLMAAIFFLTLLSILMQSSNGNPGENFLLNSSAGLIFIGLCATHLPLLMTLQDGVLWLGLLTTITIASDTGAYYTGSNFGKHKLCPAISPGKTIEGLLGGVICSVFSAIGYKVLFFPNQTTAKICTLSIALCLIGVCGDLTESIVKRANHTKDSGSILPGHGGVLDRVDSILAAAPALYYSVALNLMY